MWCELNFSLTEESERRLFNDRRRSEFLWRKTLAALNTKYNLGLPSWVFGYGEDGKPHSENANTWSMGTIGSGLRLIALGDLSANTLMEKAGAIQGALIQETQCAVPMAQRSGEHAAQFLPYAQRYIIKSLVLGKANQEDFWKVNFKKAIEGASWLELADRKLPRSLEKSLIAQIDTLLANGDEVEGSMGGFIAGAVNGDRSWREATDVLRERMAIKMVSVGGEALYHVRDKAYEVILKNVVFTANVDLQGPFFVGRHRIANNGLILKSIFVPELEVAA